MSQHPANVALRIMLEMAALMAYVFWGWMLHTGIMQVVWGIGLPLVVVLVWGVFRAPGDDGTGLIEVSGTARLLTEWVIFGLAAMLYAAADRYEATVIMALLVVLHYMLSYDRVMWLIKN